MRPGSRVLEFSYQVKCKSHFRMITGLRALTSPVVETIAAGAADGRHWNDSCPPQLWRFGVSA